jgi:hypothetical protein
MSIWTDEYRFATVRTWWLNGCLTSYRHKRQSVVDRRAYPSREWLPNQLEGIFF